MLRQLRAKWWAWAITVPLSAILVVVLVVVGFRLYLFVHAPKFRDLHYIGAETHYLSLNDQEPDFHYKGSSSSGKELAAQVIIDMQKQGWHFDSVDGKNVPICNGGELRWRQWPDQVRTGDLYYFSKPDSKYKRNKPQAFVVLLPPNSERRNHQGDTLNEIGCGRGAGEYYMEVTILAGS